MDKSRLKELLKKYFENEISEVEETEMFYLISSVDQKEFSALLPDNGFWERPLKIPSDRDTSLNFERILNSIVPADDTTTRIVKFHFSGIWKKVLLAACVMGFVVLFFFNRTNKKNTTMSYARHSLMRDKMEQFDLGCYIQLGEGTIIKTDSIYNGKVAKGVIKKDGILYLKSFQEHILLFTTRGCTQKVVLEDGTHIWLNASTSLSTEYSSHSRNIDLLGEAYFQVEHNADRPFFVHVAGQTIEDIGTSFNVAAYDEKNAAKTTLVEGIVKVDKTTLRPGEQYYNGEIHKVDTSAVIAWKNGLFHFNRTELHDLLNEVSVWYGLKVIYKRNPGLQYFDGEIQKNLSKENLISLLQSMGINCKLEKGTIVYQ